MKIFRTDPDDGLQAAQTALTQTEQRLGEFQMERAAKIEQSEGEDFINAVAKIDNEIDRLRANAGAYRDRVTAMQAKRRQQVQARLEQERVAGIAEVRKRFSKGLEDWREVEAAVMHLRQVFAKAVKGEEENFDSFPSSVSPLGHLAHFRVEAFEPLSTRRRPGPPSAGLVRRIAEHEPFNIVGFIEARNRELIEMLESAPVEHEASAA